MNIVIRAFRAASITNLAQQWAQRAHSLQKQHNVTCYVESSSIQKYTPVFLWGRLQERCDWSVHDPPSRTRPAIGGGQWSTLKLAEQAVEVRGRCGVFFTRGPLEGCLVRSQRRETQHVFTRVFRDNFQDYSEGEFSRSGDEVRGGRECAIATAATAAGIVASLESHTVAAMGTSFLTGSLPGGFSLRFPWVNADPYFSP